MTEFLADLFLSAVVMWFMSCYRVHSMTLESACSTPIIHGGLQNFNNS